MTKSIIAKHVSRVYYCVERERDAPHEATLVAKIDNFKRFYADDREAILKTDTPTLRPYTFENHDYMSPSRCHLLLPYPPPFNYATFRNS